MLNRYVGESERRVRDLFQPAERAWAKDGPASPLHVIVLDEMDAFSRVRGSLAGDPGIRDAIVNTLLAKMDGVRALENVLVVGTTNRMELIDPALLRPGRFEVHLELSAPSTAAARRRVLAIHSDRAARAGRLCPDAGAALDRVADEGEGLTGADLAAVVRAAAARALVRSDTDGGVVTAEDLAAAMDEVSRTAAAVRRARRRAVTGSSAYSSPSAVAQWSVEDVVAWASACRGVPPEGAKALEHCRVDGEQPRAPPSDTPSAHPNLRVQALRWVSSPP